MPTPCAVVAHTILLSLVKYSLMLFPKKGPDPVSIFLTFFICCSDKSHCQKKLSIFGSPTTGSICRTRRTEQRCWFHNHLGYCNVNVLAIGCNDIYNHPMFSNTSYTYDVV